MKCSINKLKKYLLIYHPEEEIWDVDLDVFISYAQNLRDNNEKGSGISKQFSQIRSLLEYCLRLGHGHKNVLHSFSIQDHGPIYQPRFLTINETEKLLLKCSRQTKKDRKERLIILILYGLGLRTSELMNIKIKNIDIEKQELYVCGKFDIERKIPIPDSVWIELLAYLQENGLDRGLLFRTEVKKTKLSIRDVGDVVKKIATEADLDGIVTPKTLRHTFATHLMDQGVDIAIISSLMGHKSPRETGVYLHAFNERKEEAIMSMAPILNGEDT
jgi:site-specific recombinase XerD